MITEDQFTVKVVLLQKWVTVHLNTQTCTHKQIVEIFFYLFSFYLPFATFMSLKDLHTFLLLFLLLFLFLLFLAEIKDPIRGECPSTKIAPLDIKNLVFLVYHPLCIDK